MMMGAIQTFYETLLKERPADVCNSIVFLCLEASDAGVGRCITLGTMDVFNGYATNIGVLPVFQPLPTCDPAVFGPHIAEFALYTDLVIRDGGLSVSDDEQD